jgi:hypothetical protein
VKQAEIYRSRGDAVPSGYYVDRSMHAYTMTLPAGFKRSLAELGPTDRWLDIGAGEGRAVLDYCSAQYDEIQGEQRPAKKAQAVAISIEDRRTSRWYQTVAMLEANQARYLFGRRFGEYTEEELGKFRVITDVLGGFSYTDRLSSFTEKALNALELNGVFYTVLQDVRSEKGDNRPHYPDSPYLTEIADARGADVGTCAWLKRIGCVEVSCEFRPDFTPPIEVYSVRKVCDDITVPPLTLVHFTAGTPPERRFHLQRSPVERSEASRQ